MPLTPRQERFAQEYVLTGNAAEAYRRAYPRSQKWAESTLYPRASTLLTHSKVSARIHGLQQKLNEKFEITAERLLQEQARIALFDFRKLYDGDGKLIDPREMPDDVASAVSSVKVKRVFREDGNYEDIIELKLWNKNTALESLFKNKGLYEKDNRQKAVTLTEILAEIDGQARSLPGGDL